MWHYDEGCLITMNCSGLETAVGSLSLSLLLLEVPVTQLNLCGAQKAETVQCSES